jgi:hypothetical protein
VTVGWLRAVDRCRCETGRPHLHLYCDEPGCRWQVRMEPPPRFPLFAAARYIEDHNPTHNKDNN